MMAYISKIQQLSALMVSQKYKNVIIIIDRSIFTDKHIFVEMLHDSGTLNDIEYNIYLKWFDAYKEGINLDGIIYLNTSVNTCMERIQKRNRPGEILISEKYLQSCHGYHEKWLNNLKEPTVLSLDGNRDLNSDYNAHIIEIQKFISSNINLLFHQKETDIIKLLKTHPIM
jgi:deoxyadenosine/deoxycytidine kinase